jgi:phosphate transport system protein
MQRQFEQELDRIKQQVLTMAGLVEQVLDDVAKAITTRDRALAQRVIDSDDHIDNCEVEIDRLATEFIVRQQPMAVDLRFVIVAIKLGPELERIADNAGNIARYMLDLEDEDWVGPMLDLPRMLALARAMVSDAIAAYVGRDADRAREVIERDDEVDQYYWKIFRDLVDVVTQEPSSVTRSISLIFVARFAERIADQATNIGEEVVYLVEGTPIRHADPDVGDTDSEGGSTHDH